MTCPLCPILRRRLDAAHQALDLARAEMGSESRRAVRAEEALRRVTLELKDYRAFVEASLVLPGAEKNGHGQKNGNGKK